MKNTNFYFPNMKTTF